MRQRRIFLLAMLALSLAATVGLPSLVASTYAPFTDVENISASAQAGVWTGSITIVKDVAGTTTEPADFSFTENIGDGCTVGPLDDDTGSATPASVVCNNVEPGSYTVTETNPAPAFALTGLSCSTTVPASDTTTTSLVTRTATIDLDAGESVTCTFVNTKQAGTIVITKDVAGTTTEPTDFTFAENIDNGCVVGPLDDDTGSVTPTNSVTCSNVTAGSYFVTENDPGATFSLTALTCSDPDSGTTTSVATRTATIDLDGGETVNCTFTNTPQGGSITIIKDAETSTGGATHAQDFSFTATGTGMSNFALDDDGNNSTAGGGLSNTKIFAGLTPGGTRSVTEVTTTTFTLTNIVCSGAVSSSITIAGAVSDSDFDFGDTTVSIVVANQENITCTFTNIEVPPECAGLFNNPNPARVFVTAGVTFNGGNQDQIVVGTSGNDTINGGNAKDCILGGGGSDTIHGMNGSDVILGGTGNDFLFGDQAPDDIFGEDGDDTIDGGSGGGDNCRGGNGTDTAVDCEITSTIP